MATIIRKEERDFQPNPGKADGFRLFTDMSREQKGVRPQYLNSGLTAECNPGEPCTIIDGSTHYAGKCVAEVTSTSVSCTCQFSSDDLKISGSDSACFKITP